VYTARLAASLGMRFGGRYYFRDIIGGKIERWILGAVGAGFDDDVRWGSESSSKLGFGSAENFRFVGFGSENIFRSSTRFDSDLIRNSICLLNILREGGPHGERAWWVSFLGEGV